MNDLRYALRQLLKHRGFTAVAVLTLALGIGVNTSMFSALQELLARPLPYPDAGRLVQLFQISPHSQREPHHSPANFLDYQAQDPDFRFMAALNDRQFNLAEPGQPAERVRGMQVSADFFALLGVQPEIGRAFSADEDRPGKNQVVILDHRFWVEHFAGATNSIGRVLRVDGESVTVIGVMPSRFHDIMLNGPVSLWRPIAFTDRDRQDRGGNYLKCIARLKPDMSLAQGQARMDLLAAQLAHDHPDNSPDGLRLVPLAESSLPPEARRIVWSIMAIAAFVLLIACANLANLLLARGAARKSEIALRLSLGASRGRLIRQLITESLALAVMGGVAGVAVAYLLHGALVRMMAEYRRDFQMSFSLDPLVLAFAVAATLAAALLFGVLPAWQSTRYDAATALKEQGRSAAGSLGRLRSGRLLVSLQLALSLPLLVGAGLLARTVYNLQCTDLGFPAEHLLLVRVDLREAGVEPARRDGLLRELIGQFQQIPGLRAVSYSQLGLFSGGESLESVEVEGYSPKADRGENSALDVVGPGYFSALGVPIFLGRDILDSDDLGAPKTCVINEAFARRFFDRRNPIGMHVTSVADDKRTTYQVVGVARNSRSQDLRGDIRPRFFQSAKQLPAEVKSPTFLIRTSTGDAPVMAAVRKAIQRVDASLPIDEARTIKEQEAPLTAQDRTTAQLAVVFGCVALALAAIGLYGVLSYGIARRRSEIAVRIALGARPGRVVAMILRDTMGLVIAGLAVGGGLAYAATRMIGSRLYGVAPQDPLTVALATGLLVLVALSAAYLPARRASRLDPMVALRQE